MEALAEALEVSARTLRNWKRRDPAANPRLPGPCPVSGAEMEVLRGRVRAELERQGWEAGERPIQRALPDISLWRVREILRELKAERRARMAEAARRRRKSMRVHKKDALWAIDATHLGRNRHGNVLEAEVVRELASGMTLHLSVGAPSDGDTVVELLRAAGECRGCLPLVLISDNGRPYLSARTQAWLAEMRIIHLRTLPHTPQHNAGSEHGHGELKRDSGLGKGIVLDPKEALLRMEASRERLDAYRLRASRGWRTARQADRETPSWVGSIDRERFYRDATCAIRNAVLDCKTPRARRLAEREAILSTLERYGAITRTEGGAPKPPSIAEGNT